MKAIYSVLQQHRLLKDGEFLKISEPQMWIGSYQNFLPSNMIESTSNSTSHQKWNAQKKEAFMHQLKVNSKLEHWPGEHFIHDCVKIAFMASQRSHEKVQLPDAPTPSDRMTVETMSQLVVRYRAYLTALPSVKTSNVQEPDEYFALERKSSINANKDVAEVSSRQILSYIHGSLEYVRQYAKQCDSSLHSALFLGFDLEMRTLEKCVAAASDRGVTNFARLRDRVRTTSFQTELKLLSASLEAAATTMQVYFSDDGFAVAGANTPVWSYEPERRQIIETLSACRKGNPNLHFHRILLLDSLDPAMLDTNQLRALSEDIAFLVDSGINISISKKSLAQSIDRDMYNYAIVSDGTIMRASEGHSEWRIAKVKTSDQEYKVLWKNYNAMRYDVAGDNSRCEFPVTIADRNDWKAQTTEAGRVDIILHRLCDWIHNIPSQYY